MNLISLVETQINPSTRSCKDSLYVAIFRNEPSTQILINNVNELIGRRQQGGVMTLAKGDFTKCITSTGSDPICLGRWDCIEIVNGNKNGASCMHANVCDQKQRLSQCTSNVDVTFSL